MGLSLKDTKYDGTLYTQSGGRRQHVASTRDMYKHTVSVGKETEEGSHDCICVGLFQMHGARPESLQVTCCYCSTLDPQNIMQICAIPHTLLLRTGLLPVISKKGYRKGAKGQQEEEVAKCHVGLNVPRMTDCCPAAI